MLQKMQKTIDKFHMICPGDRVLAGVSGGADSICLLLLLKELQKEVDFVLEIIHVEHGIRGEESKNDAEFVVDLCRKYELECHKIEVDVPKYCSETGLGTEEGARVLRYQVFEQLAKQKGAKVALAHHKEDNAETILFQMVRGSSLTGLCGMQPVRWDENGVSYIRPLLSFHREEIEAYLKKENQIWREDSTNLELEYSRNYMRAQVIPQLAEINRQAVAHINQTAEQLSEIKDYLDIETEKWWSEIAETGDGVSLKVAPLLELHSVMQRQLAYKAIILTAGRKKDITYTHVSDLLDLCRGQSGKQISLPYGICARKEFDRVYVSVIKETEVEGLLDEVYEVTQEVLEALILKPGEKITIPMGETKSLLFCRLIPNQVENVEIPRKTYTKWMDYDKIKEGFCIRTRRSGDYLISDALGHRKKLKSYFIDEKVPAEERNKCWLLAKNSEILWVIGGRISEHIKVSQETKYILEITYDGGDVDE